MAHSITERRLASLLDNIYSASERDSDWESVPSLLANTFDAHQALLYHQADLTISDEVPQIASAGLDPAIAEIYPAYLEHDLWLQRSLRASPGSVMASEELLDLKSLKQSLFYADMCVPANVEHMLNGAIDTNPRSVSAVAVQRSKSSGPFDEADKRLMHSLVPHLKRAMRLRSTLAGSNGLPSVSSSVLEVIEAPVILLSESLAPLWWNKAADRLLQEESRLAIYGRKLSAVDRDDQKRLESALLCCLKGDPVRDWQDGLDTVLRQTVGHPELLATAYPLSTQTDAYSIGKAKIALVISNPRPSIAVPWAAVQSDYGLTNAELRVVRKLVEGLALKGIAELFGVQEGTVRSQLKSVFRKCDVSSQSSLILLLLSGRRRND